MEFKFSFGEIFLIRSWLGINRAIDFTFWPQRFGRFSRIRFTCLIAETFVDIFECFVYGFCVHFIRNQWQESSVTSKGFGDIVFKRLHIGPGIILPSNAREIAQTAIDALPAWSLWKDSDSIWIRPSGLRNLNKNCFFFNSFELFEHWIYFLCKYLFEL